MDWVELVTVPLLAYTRRSQGRDKEVIALMKEATRLQGKDWSLDHPDTIKLTQTLTKHPHPGLDLTRSSRPTFNVGVMHNIDKCEAQELFALIQIAFLNPL